MAGAGGADIVDGPTRTEAPRASRRQSVTPATELSTSRRHPFGFVYGPWLALMRGPISVKAETILRFSERDPRRIGRVQNDGTPRPREGSDRDRDVTRPRERRRSISHPGSGHPHDTRTVGGAPRRGTTSPEATTILINGDDGQGPRRAGSRAAGGQDAVSQRPGERAVVHIAHRAAGGGQPPAPGAAHRANRASHERARERVRGFRHRRRHETLQLVHVHADQIQPPRRGAASERRWARERRQRGRRGRRASRSIRGRSRPPQQRPLPSYADHPDVAPPRRRNQRDVIHLLCRLPEQSHVQPRAGARSRDTRRKARGGRDAHGPDGCSRRSTRQAQRRRRRRRRAIVLIVSGSNDTAIDGCRLPEAFQQRRPRRVRRAGRRGGLRNPADPQR